MRTKYIVGELPSGHGTTLGAIVFPEYVAHNHVASLFAPGPDNLYSAGFFTVENGQVCPYGESVGLGLKARVADAAAIARAIGLHPSCR